MSPYSTHHADPTILLSVIPISTFSFDFWLGFRYMGKFPFWIFGWIFLWIFIE
ncbi:hypothetical protein RhiirB3_455395 [Rhizophagus irregularis]|nr:hypothetical protein RhiirB3_455395 [Rhizophagus irregularis]